MSAAHVDVHNIRIPKLPPSQIANAIYWTLKKNNPFDEQEMFFDFEVQGEVIELGITKLAVMVYTAPRRTVEEIRLIFSKIGWPLTGISIAPFAMQNILRTHWIDVQKKIITSLYIGNDFSRIDIYSAGNLVMTRDIKAGTNSMIEALVDAYNDRRPSENPLDMKQARKTLFNIFGSSLPSTETSAGIAIDEQEIFAMILPPLERLVRQVDMTFQYFSTEHQQEKITGIYVSGVLSIYRPILDYIQKQLDIQCEILDPLSSRDSLSICKNIDESDCLTKRVPFMPALGLSFADNAYTPNFIFTFKDKEREATIKKINRGVFTVFIASVFILGAVFLYQQRAIDSKRLDISRLQGSLSGTGPKVDRNQLLKIAASVNKERSLAGGKAERYMALALLNELIGQTPPDIRIINLKISLPKEPPRKPDDKTPAEQVKKQAGEISVDGLVLGNEQKFESILAGYVMSLETSPLFSGVAVPKSAVERYPKNTVLRFMLNMKVGGGNG